MDSRTKPDRQQRLAEALRSNLKRRKTLARERAADRSRQDAAPDDQQATPAPDGGTRSRD